MKLPVISVNGTEHICADNAGLDDDPVFLQCEITKLQIACHSVKSQFAHQTFFIFYQNIDHHRSYPGSSRADTLFRRRQTDMARPAAGRHPRRKREF